jgi:uncharacterized lipoprotein
MESNIPKKNRFSGLSVEEFRTMLVCIIDDFCKDEDEEYLKAKALELWGGEQPSEVLYARFEEGYVGLDTDYVAPLLYLWKQKLLAASTVEEMMAIISKIQKVLSPDKKQSPSLILKGDYGVNAQNSFLAGALYAADIAIDVHIIESKVAQARE